MTIRRRLVRPEKDLVKTILAYLATRPDVLAWRQNTGAVRIGNRFVRFGQPGCADITGVLKGGRRLEIECKSERGTLSPEQEAFGKRINHYGGLWLVARSLDDVRRALDVFSEASAVLKRGYLYTGK